MLANASAHGDTSKVEAPVELLRTSAGVLDIRRVFPRVSEIVGRRASLHRVRRDMRFEGRDQRVDRPPRRH